MKLWFNAYVYSVFTSNFARIFDGDSASDTVNALAIDSSGNLYVAGTYSNSAYISTLLYGTVGSLPISAGSSVAFVSKFDSTGTYQWSRIVDGTGADTGNGVACDSVGNVYLAGTYIGTPSIKDQTGTTLATLPPVLAGVAGDAAFVSKFNSSGTYQYSRTVDTSGASTSGDSGLGVACDSSDNVYLAGTYGINFIAYVRTASNANVFSNVGQLPITIGGNQGAFVAKFNSSGTYQYTRIVDGSTGTDTGYSVACDSSGNLYFAGSYNTGAFIRTVSNSNVVANVAFFPSSLGSTVAGFVSKFDSSGTYQYSRVVDGAGGVEAGYGVTCDSSGNLYFTGQYSTGTVYVRTASNANVFANVAALPTSLGGLAGFVSKFDSSGTYQYTRIVDGSGNDIGYGVVCDSSGNMYFTGQYVQGTVYVRTADSSNNFANVATLPTSLATNNTAAFVSKFDSSGTYQFSRIVDGTSGNEVGSAVACDSIGNVYFGGEYDSAIPYIRTANATNVFSNITTLPAASGTQAGFVIKFTSSGDFTAPTQTYSTFARVVDSAGADVVNGVALDSSGNIYIAGTYTGTPAIKNAGGTTLATLPASVNAAAFFSKFDSSGTYQYSRIIDGTASGTTDDGYAIACDSSGNVYLAGRYDTNANVITQAGTVVARLPTTIATQAAFLAKFDSTGTYQYSRLIDGGGTDRGYAVACDSSGNVYFGGEYTTSGTVYVRTADSSNNFANVATLTTSFGGGGPAFVAKFDSSGTYQYSRLINASTDATGYGLVCDSTGNVYLCGTYRAGGTGGWCNVVTATAANVFANVASLPPTDGGSAGATVFVSKFNSSGTYQYSRIVDTSNAVRNEIGYSVACDSSDNLYLAGQYSGTSGTTPFIKTATAANAFANVAQLPATANTAAFLSKFDSSGTYQYSRVVESTSSTAELSQSVVCDNSGSVYLAGQYAARANIITASATNVFANVATLPLASNAAAFLAKFDSSGNHVYARVVDSTSSTNDVGNGVAVDSNRNVYLVGTYNATSTIEDQNGTSIGTLPAATGTAGFLIKFNEDGAYSAA